jgi:hypothetical protein
MVGTHPTATSAVILFGWRGAGSEKERGRRKIGRSKISAEGWISARAEVQKGSSADARKEVCK